jgi:hypothetical protein
MPLSSTDKDVLEEIVKVEGQCLDSKRCAKCPFRAKCLPEFLNTIPPSPPERAKMAMDVLAHHYLVDEDVEVEEIKKDYEWKEK